MHDTLSAPDLRRWAAQCADEAVRTCSQDDRERLLKMRDSLLSLAESADWLAGLSTGTWHKARRDHRRLDRAFGGNS